MIYRWLRVLILTSRYINTVEFLQCNSLWLIYYLLCILINLLSNLQDDQCICLLFFLNVQNVKKFECRN